MSQSREALLRANESKRLRADLRRRLKSGEVGPAEIFVELPWWLTRMPIGKFTTWPRRLYGTVAKQILRDVQVWEGRELGALTDRQLAVLKQAFEDWEEGQQKGKTYRDISERRDRRERAEATA